MDSVSEHIKNMMKNILRKRKTDGKKNIEFEVANCVEWCDGDEIKNTEKLSTLKIIANIKAGLKYYTKNIDNSDAIVVVEGGDVINEYLSSISNDGVTDNINELPIYK